MTNNSKYKVLFIIQPDTMRIRASVAEKLDFGREFRATLGLLCVAGMLRDMEGVEVDTAELAMVPQILMELDDSHAKQTLRLLEMLEDLDDVQKVFSNADFSDEVLAEFSVA